MSAYLAHAAVAAIRCCAGGISLFHSRLRHGGGDRPNHRCRHRRDRGHSARRYREREAVDTGDTHGGHRLRGQYVFANLPPAQCESRLSLRASILAAKVTVSVGGAFNVPIKMDVACPRKTSTSSLSAAHQRPTAKSRPRSPKRRFESCDHRPRLRPGSHGGQRVGRQGRRR